MLVGTRTTLVFPYTYVYVCWRVQVAIYPLEIAKTRLAVSRTGEYSGIADCIRATLKDGGVST